MREERFFYARTASEASATISLPDDEAQHAVRVLRLTEGDEVWAMNGRGAFFRCEIALASRKACELNVLEALPQSKTWHGTLTLAIAPTKNMDRIEWMVEKAVEIGVDRIVPLLCHNSERTVVKTERLERIAVSAMKQSRKPWVTGIEPLTKFEDLVETATGKRFIAHCHNDLGERINLCDFTNEGKEDMTVLVGPEGDFTAEEVTAAVKSGFVPVSLGESRLRTETAGMVAVHLMQLINKL